MTVSELIEALKQFPGDQRVVVRGYEDGVDDVTRVLLVRVSLNANSEWYYGKHAYTDEGDTLVVKVE